jgi:hypothetical protein
MRKQHIVVLSEAERARLRTLIGQGTAPARALRNLSTLLRRWAGLFTEPPPLSARAG